MTLSLITFSDYSESSEHKMAQPSCSFRENPQSNKIIPRRPLPHFPLVRSVVRKINIGSEESDLSNNTFSKPNSSLNLSSQTSQISNKQKYTYKNGRKILISETNTSPKNACFKRNFNNRLIQFNTDSDSESYYSDYSYSQYYSDAQQNDEIQNNSNDINSNNLPNLDSLNDNQNTISKSLNESSNSIINDLNPNKRYDNIIADSKSEIQAQNVIFDKYIVERKKSKFSIMGKSMKYVLNRSEGSNLIPYIEAIVSGSKASIINVNTQEIIGSIKAKKSHSRFIIQKNNSYNKMSMEIIYTSYNNVKPRSSVIKLYDQVFPHNENESKVNPNVLYSRHPKRGTFGMWSLDFGSRKIISSIKNSIIVDDNNNEYVILGKVSENSLSVEVAEGMDPICALGIAVSTYMNTKP